MHVTTPALAVAAADIVFVLAPDHLHGELYKKSVHSHLRPGMALVFAHASSIHFGLILPPDDVDVILIAPLGPGKRLRELRGRRNGVGCFFSVYQDASGDARGVGLALAKRIGCLPAGAIETTFAAEAVGDLFGEQAVLCGGLSALLQAGVETLVRHGLKPEAAYLECVYQLDLIVDLIKSDGLEGMLRQISPTAAYGALVAGPQVIGAPSRRAMDALYRQIASGTFLRSWVKRSRKASGRLQPKVSAPFRRGERAILTLFDGTNLRSS
jgi:ketol-acid reductoisomerase